MVTYTRSFPLHFLVADGWVEAHSHRPPQRFPHAARSRTVRIKGGGSVDGSRALGEQTTLVALMTAMMASIDLRKLCPKEEDLS
jgi:hypothetical protein